MSRFYGLNGSVGRAKTLAGIRRDKRAEAAADGVDVTDRVAFKEWDRQRLKALCDRLVNIPHG